MTQKVTPNLIDMDALDTALAALGYTKSFQLASQSTTSGTQKDFTIPADARRVYVHMHNISVAAASVQMSIRLGYSGGVITSGYNSQTHASNAPQNATDRFIIQRLSADANVSSGLATLSRMDDATNVWNITGAITYDNVGYCDKFAGSVELPGSLTLLRFYVPTSSFDAGSVGVTYEV